MLAALWLLLSTAPAAAEQINVLTAPGTRLLSASSEQQPSGPWSADALTDGSAGKTGQGWSSADGQYIHEFEWQLDAPYTLTRIVADNRGTREDDTPGISARNLALFAPNPDLAGTEMVLAYGDAAQGERTEFMLQTPVTVEQLKLSIMSNWGFDGRTELMEFEAWGEPAADSGSGSGSSTSDPEPPPDDPEPDPDPIPDNEYRWDGMIRVMQFGPILGDSGNLQVDWNIRVTLKEQTRIDAVDRDGRLVGQFILLEDDGSSWNAAQSGRIDSYSDCHHRWSIYQGNGSGHRAVKFGWVYFSHSEDDPLADVLPSGSYFLRGDPSQTFDGEVDHWSADLCDGGVLHQHRVQPAFILSFMIGRHLVHPLDRAGKPIDAERFRQHILNAAGHSAMPIRVMDRDKRVVRDDSMAGSYTSVGAGDGDLYWRVTWDIARDADIAFTER